MYKMKKKTEKSVEFTDDIGGLEQQQCNAWFSVGLAGIWVPSYHGMACPVVVDGGDASRYGRIE
jgi:hypothetical protein